MKIRQFYILSSHMALLSLFLKSHLQSCYQVLSSTSLRLLTTMKCATAIYIFPSHVGNPNSSLVLTVMDREDTLGNITLPVVSLPSAAHKRRWLPLKRKHQQTSSDLCFDCWVTQFKKETVWNKFNPFFLSASR